MQHPGKPRRLTPLSSSSLNLNRGPALHGAPPDSPLPHPEVSPQDPTSAPTDPPTSCHCLGSNPSSVPAAWRALPGQGAAGLQGCPLMPRRVGGPELKAGLRLLASTNWACLSASCRLQKPEELIKNRWGPRGGRSCRPRPQPQLFLAQPSDAGSFLPRRPDALRCRRLPRGIRLLQSMLLAPPALPMPLLGAGVTLPPPKARLVS